MSAGCDSEFPRLIDAIVVEELSPPRWRALHEHVKGCDSCRARYDRTLLAERMLHGGPDAALAQSPSEIAAIERAVLAAALEGAPARGWRSWLTRITSPLRLATAAAALVAVFAIVPKLLRGPAPAETFEVRGGVEPAQPVGVRAFCVTPEGVAALDPAVQVPSCRRDASLQLAVSNRGGYRSLFLVGIDEDHQVKWYTPRPPATESVPAPAPGSVDVPVGGGVRLAVNHRPGRLRIFGLFSDRPISVAEVERAASELSRRAVPLDGAGELPLGRPDVHQASLTVEIAP